MATLELKFIHPPKVLLPLASQFVKPQSSSVAEWVLTLRRGQPIEAACQEKTLQALARLWAISFFHLLDALVFLYYSHF
ncbi:MAG: hypothetical protein ACR2IB_08950, partial [Pyrinomonadaceae bacterium]